MLADRVERLRKELVEAEAEVARLEAAEVVFGQFIEAERAGEADDPAVDAEFERVTTAPGAGGMRLVPDRADGMDVGVLPEEYQAIMRLVADATEPAQAGQVSEALGNGTLPGQVEAVRASGSGSRSGAGCTAPRAAGSRSSMTPSGDRRHT